MIVMMTACYSTKTNPLDIKMKMMIEIIYFLFIFIIVWYLSQIIYGRLERRAS